MTKLERGRRILGDEGQFDRDGGRPMPGDHFFDRAVQRQKAKSKTVCDARCDHAMGDMVQPRARYRDHAPAHPGEAGV